jgi:lipopolysaccharide export LptBFGC system permease protein LptF
MDNNIQTSFIPKKPIVEDSKISSSSVSLFLVVAIIIFLVSLSLMAWVTFTKTNLINQIKENKAIIEKNKGEFEAGTIESISITHRQPRCCFSYI